MKYHKINSIFKRDMDTKHKLFISGDYAEPETEYLKDNEWTFTEKIDGTNVRVMLDGHGLRFGGRNDNSQMPITLMERLQELFTEEKLMKAFDDPDIGIVLYGEGCGWRIQKGGMGYVDNEKRVDFILFDVRVGDWWLKREDVEDVAEKLGVRVAPVVLKGTIDEGIKLVSEGFTSTYGDFTAEGIVGKPSVDLVSRSGNRIVTKIKNRDFVHLREQENTS